MCLCFCATHLVVGTPLKASHSVHIFFKHKQQQLKRLSQLNQMVVIDLGSRKCLKFTDYTVNLFSMKHLICLCPSSTYWLLKMGFEMSLYLFFIMYMSEKMCIITALYSLSCAMQTDVSISPPGSAYKLTKCLMIIMRVCSHVCSPMLPCLGVHQEEQGGGED